MEIRIFFANIIPSVGSWKDKNSFPDGFRPEGQRFKMDQMIIHEQYMKRAIELAELGRGYTSPNPMVGCVVVKDGRVISEGYHERCGEFHAERNALLRCAEDPEGADLYVTLEPCCHYGKTPPCTEIIIEKKIARVFIGSLDPNPLVAGKGMKILNEHGIQTESGILEKECLKLNEIFFHYITTKTPFVLSKFAMSLDGKIACPGGDSKWVTGEEARAEVHSLRKYYSGIMVGIGTVLADDPMLNCRIEEGVDPVRIVCDSRLRIPLESRILQTARRIPTIIAASKDHENPEKETKIRELGAEVVRTSKETKVDLNELMKILGEKGIDSILLEGGGTLNAEAFRAGIVNKVQAYIAGKIIGGETARTPVEGEGASCMKEAIRLKETEVRKIGEDIRVTGYPVR